MEKNRNQKSEIRNQISEIRNPKSAIINQESDIRNQKSEIRNQKSEIRNQESGIRNQESGIRNQKSKIRNQISEIRNQKSEIRNQKSWLPRLKTPWGENNFHAQQIFYQVHCTFSPITKQRDQMSPGQTSPVFENWLSTVHTVENITINVPQLRKPPFWGCFVYKTC